MKRIVIAAVTTLAASLCAQPARAADEAFEVWSNPSVTRAVGKGEAELETAQRLRGEGREDIYFVRLWYGEEISRGLTLQGGIEQRWTGGTAERRLLQQLSYKNGPFRSRTRFEQRFIEGDDRMGLRLRQRLGVSVPLDGAGSVRAIANAEAFYTVRSGNRGGQDGLTGLRTIAGIEIAVSDMVEIGLAYQRQEEIRRRAPDRVGHAPLISLTLAL